MAINKYSFTNVIEFGNLILGIITVAYLITR